MQRLTSTLLLLGSILFSVTVQASLETSMCLDRLASGQNRGNVKINKTALINLEKGLRKFRSVTTHRTVLLVDYSKPSQEKRGYVIDMKACELLSHEYVAHGGTVYTPSLIRYGDINHDGKLDRCLHRDGSRTNMTRPGFFVTVGCHMTQKDFPKIKGACGGVKIRGLEARNEDAYNAGVVLHEHDSMFEGKGIKPEGQGCPIFATGRLKDILKFGLFEGALVYLYTPQCG